MTPQSSRSVSPACVGAWHAPSPGLAERQKSVQIDYGINGVNGSARSFSPPTGVLAPSQITTQRELVPD